MWWNVTNNVILTAMMSLKMPHPIHGGECTKANAQ